MQERATARFALEASPRGLAPAVAARVGVGLAVSAALAAVLAEAAFALAAGTCLGAAPTVWLTRRRPAALHLYGDGFADSRWPEAGRIGWGDVYALDPDYAAGTLALAMPVAEHLARLGGRPRNALVWQGDRPFYRLPLGAEVRSAVEARTGISAR